MGSSDARPVTDSSGADASRAPPRAWLAWVGAAPALALYAVFLHVSRAPPVRAFAHVDFYDYYYAALAVRAGGDPYDAASADALARSAGVPVIPGSDYIYPPWFAAALTPLALLPPCAASAVWFSLSSACLLLALRLLVPRGQPGWTAVGVLFPPVLFSLFVGQVNLVLLALLAGAWSWREVRPWRAGLSLGFAAAIKLNPVLLLVAVASARRWRFLAGAVVALAACAVVGEFATPGSTARYVTHVLPSIAALDARHAHPVNQGFGAFFLRLLAPNPWTTPWARAPWLVRPATFVACLACAALLGATVRASQPGTDREARAWSVSVCVMVAVSPLAWESSFALLLLPAALLFQTGHSRVGVGAALALIAAQRAFDDFAGQPAAHPVLRGCPPLASLALMGALLLAAIAWRGPVTTARRRSRRGHLGAPT